MKHVQDKSGICFCDMRRSWTTIGGLRRNLPLETEHSGIVRRRRSGRWSVWVATLMLCGGWMLHTGDEWRIIQQSYQKLRACSVER
jgi:hypothetical protein